MKQLKNIVHITIVAFVILFTACKKTNNGGATIDPVPAVPLTAQSTNDVAYGTDALQKFNMVLPAGRTTSSTKVLIVIHGGAWSAGDKNDMTTYIDALKAQLPNYAFFNLNYRLANATTGANAFPTQENDVKAAIDLIYSKRAEYNISDKFALLGASAGAHLALLQAYKNATPKIKAVVDLYGPTDMVDMYNSPAASSPSYLIGYITTGSIVGTPNTHASAFAASSPVNFVTAQSAPTIMFHGTADNVVKYQQSTLLQTKLVQNNVVNQLVPYVGANHAYGSPQLDDTFIKTIAFLNANVQ
jgi:acetyl esterase/lipase